MRVRERRWYGCTLSSPSTGTAEIGTSSSATGTITDDDPKFSIGNANVIEGDSGLGGHDVHSDAGFVAGAPQVTRSATPLRTAQRPREATTRRSSGTLTFAAGSDKPDICSIR